MKKISQVGVIILMLIGCHETLRAQEFLSDGSMKLSGVSTDAKYGYEEGYSQSIKVGSPDNIISYLSSLRGPHGEKVTFARVGSCCPYDMKSGPNGIGLLAQWKVSYAGLAAPISLYLNKNVYENPMCPVGFTFKTEKDVVVPIKFPADSIVAVKSCTKNAFMVEDLLLKEKLGASLPVPDKNPAFTNGPEEVEAYFARHPLVDPGVKNMGFRVSFALLVNCEGKAGNYAIATTGRGEMETYANQVLAVVNRMPQRWQPAIKDGKPVDCYQIMSFTVVRGNLGKVSIR